MRTLFDLLKYTFHSTKCLNTVMYALLLIGKQISAALTLSHDAVSVKKLQRAKFEISYNKEYAGKKFAVW